MLTSIEVLDRPWMQGFGGRSPGWREGDTDIMGRAVSGDL